MSYAQLAFLGIGPLSGGAAVAAGTYGCVFNPAIPCQGDSAGLASGLYNNAISKVMTEKDAKNEYTETENVRALVDTMPAALRNFLVVPLRAPCRIDFTPADLVRADKVCRNFETSVRENLRARSRELRSLTQVNGGLNLEVVFGRFDEPTFEHVNNGLMRLTDVVREIGLRGGIHGDIKDVNLVYNATDHNVRIIDWGFFQYLSAAYLRTQWAKFPGNINPFMQNEMLSTWMYVIDPSTVPEPSTSKSEIANWAYNQLETFLANPIFTRSNEGHLKFASMKLNECMKAASQMGMPFAIPVYTMRPFRHASDALTNALVAHAVALVLAGFKYRSRFFIDTVLRMNQDIYGLLTAYLSVKGRVSYSLSALENNIMYTAGRYLWDAKYAVEPYNLADMQAAFKELNDGMCTFAPFPAPLDPSANMDIMRMHDPKGLRAFNQATFDEAAARADIHAYNRAQVSTAMTEASALVPSAEGPVAAPQFKRPRLISRGQWKARETWSE